MAQRRKGLKNTLWITLGAMLIYGVAGYLGIDLGLHDAAPSRSVGTQPSAPAPAREGAADEGELFARLFREERSGVVVEARGVVERVLRDDLKGSRHQRFVVDVGADRGVLIAHNIDLAPRVAGVRAGDAVQFRGQYEWNERGGVVHWTHHDPQRRRPGGWIEHEGQRYE